MLQIALILGIQASEVTSPPEPLESPATWISTDDYPIEARRRAAQGSVRFRLSVDDQGIPTRCAVEASSGDDDLDDATCELMLSRARFRPARNAQGRSVPSVYTSRIQWALAADHWLIGEAPVRIVNVLTAEPGGLVRCDVTMNDGEPRGGLGFGCDIDHDWMQLRHFAYSRFPGRIVQFADSIGYRTESSQEPAPSAEALGERYFRQEVLLSISPDGRVADCRATRTSGPARGPTPPEVCRHYRGMGRLMFAATPGANGPRTIRAIHDYFIQVRNLDEPEP